jgi:Zn-finger nucleic acid-binding protein
MKCPACKGPLREKSAGGMILDTCYGGCGGIWFDQKELDRVEARAAATLHTIWQNPHSKVVLTEPRPCPRCPNEILTRRWFSALQQVEIDQCPKCGGIWLDAGEFSRICAEVGNGKITHPAWAMAVAEASASVTRQAP